MSSWDLQQTSQCYRGVWCNGWNAMCWLNTKPLQMAKTNRACSLSIDAVWRCPHTDAAFNKSFKVSWACPTITRCCTLKLSNYIIIRPSATRFVWRSQTQTLLIMCLKYYDERRSSSRGRSRSWCTSTRHDRGAPNAYDPQSVGRIWQARFIRSTNCPPSSSQICRIHVDMPDSTPQRSRAWHGYFHTVEIKCMLGQSATTKCKLSRNEMSKVYHHLLLFL